MRISLIPFADGRAVAIPEILLELMGVPGAKELELTFDGRSIRLSPSDSSAAMGAIDPAPQWSLANVNCADPKESIHALRLAQELGFTQDHFQRIHHFGAKASIQAHIAHCEGTGRFTAQTNIVVCRRLTRSIELRKQGASWDDAIATAVADHPFPQAAPEGAGITRERVLDLIEETGHTVREQVGWTHAVPAHGGSARSRRIFAFTGDPVRDIHLRGYPRPPHPAFAPSGGVLRLRPPAHAASEVVTAVTAALRELSDHRG